MRFESEAAMAQALAHAPSFHRLARRSATSYCFVAELPGLFGRPDFVVARRYGGGFSGLRIVAFELKLSSWKRALVQAYRYRSFSHQSYVVMDASRIAGAMANLHLFRAAGVGLVSANPSGDLVVVHSPRTRRPFSNHLWAECKRNLSEIMAENRATESGLITSWGTAQPEEPIWEHPNARITF